MIKSKEIAMRDQRHFSLRLFSAMAAVVLFSFSSVGAAWCKEPPTDLCSLLPAAKLTKVLNQTFDSPVKSTAPAAYHNTPTGTQCSYASKDGFPRKIVFITYVEPSAAAAKENFAKLKMWFGPPTPVAGVGDDAYRDSNCAIHVQKGRVRYYINMVPIGTYTPEKEKQLKDLAESVAGQI
jgi:hypothetical protein